MTTMSEVIRFVLAAAFMVLGVGAILLSVLGVLLSDLAYGIVDPRVKLE